MRTLNAALTTAQQSASATPYLNILFTSVGGSTATYTMADSPNLIVYVSQQEKQYEGKATIILDNSNGAFNAVNYVGYRVQIGWGFNCAGTNRYSNAPYMWVVGQQIVSREGKVVIQFDCVDVWVLMNETRVFADATRLTGTVTKDSEYNPIGKKLVQGAVSGTITHYKSSGLLVSNVTGGAFTTGNAAVGAKDRKSVV